MWACGDDVLRETEPTQASLHTIRGSLESSPFVRVGADEEVDAGGLQRLRLDRGPSLLLEDARFTLTEDALILGAGRAFVAVEGDDSLALRVGEHTLQFRDAQASVDADGEVYVVRGQVAASQGTGDSSRRFIIAAGERMTLQTGQVEAAALWVDWTGGLAEPGPGLEETGAIGALVGRIPDEVGQARWPLVIRRLEVRVRVVQGLAITEVEEVFFNPASETVEGLYRIRVPEGAVLQRFAVDRNGELVDGYVREKAQAQQAYERQVYRGSTLDPALLEWTAPGRYQARIYPIAPGAERRISVRYAEWLERPAADAPLVYRFPMATDGEAPRVQEFSFEADLSQGPRGPIRVGGGAEVEGHMVRLRQSDVEPRADLVLEIDDTPTGLSAWRAAHAPPARDPNAGAMPDEAEDDYVYIPLVLPDSLFEESEGALSTAMDVVVVADVSAGTDRAQLELGRSVVESIAAHLDSEDRLAIVASDVGLRTFEPGDELLGPASPERVEALLGALARVPSGGATDLGGSLTAAAELLGESRHGLVVYVGDGAPTVGELGAEALLRRLGRLPQPLRTYAVAVGEDAQLDLLEAVTHGGGLAMRVETRSAAGEAALRLMAHARRPVAQRVEVTLEGADQLFPREPSDVVRGSVFPVAARAEGAIGAEITVRGMIGGEEFEATLPITETRVADEGDLRLRWAGERLRQLLLGGGRREEIADLGVRYGLITPYTSFYVPSAAELSSLGEGARELMREESMFAAQRGPARGMLALGSLAALMSMTGCSESEDKGSWSPVSAFGPEASGESEEITEGTTAVAPLEDSVAEDPAAAARPAPIMPQAPEPEPEVATRAVERNQERSEPRRRNRRARPSSMSASGPSDAFDDMPDESAVDAPMNGAPPDGNVFGRESARGNDPMQALGQLMGGQLGEEQGFAGLGLRGTGRGGGGTGAGTLGITGADEEGLARGYVNDGRRASGDERSELFDDSESDLDNAQRSGRIHPITTSTRTTVRFVPASHQRRRCSDASDLLLDRRRELWNERLSAAGGIAAKVAIYRTAIRGCEAPRWRDRRALLDAILSHTGGIHARIALYRGMSSGSARTYLRRAILRAVRMPADLTEARKVFGTVHDADLVAQILERAGDGAGRIRALRRLCLQFPSDLDLKLMHLEALEAAGRLPEARRLAQELRVDPLTDAGVRTAIGEMFLRLDDEAEARRVFGEIVEFAPADALARRRLGDLFRAHGWFEDAYRQYQTLATITPDDPSVSLLLAQAAAGAGRVDEALRLEQRLAETAQPGSAVGLAHTALLWSSVRFAELRAEARESGNDERLDALRARMRRSGVLRQSVPLRATLVWSHPEAGLSLYGAYPGVGLARPQHLSPEYGLEAFEADPLAEGQYRFEVRRSPLAHGDHLTAVQARLVVIWNEGTAEERVSIAPISFEGSRERATFTVENGELQEVGR